jgi:hypothetical protein
MAAGAIRRGHSAHPDNRFSGEPESKAAAAGVEDGRRETHSRDQRSWSQVGPAAPWFQPCSGQLSALTCHRPERISAEADVSPSLLSVSRLEPLARRELTTEVEAGFVLASALRLERDAGVAGGGNERCVLAQHVTSVSERLSTRRAVRIHNIRRLSHAYTVGVGDRRDHGGLRCAVAPKLAVALIAAALSAA